MPQLSVSSSAGSSIKSQRLGALHLRNESRHIEKKHAEVADDGLYLNGKLYEGEGGRHDDFRSAFTPLEVPFATDLLQEATLEGRRRIANTLDGSSEFDTIATLRDLMHKNKPLRQAVSEKIIDTTARRHLKVHKIPLNRGFEERWDDACHLAVKLPSDLVNESLDMLKGEESGWKGAVDKVIGVTGTLLWVALSPLTAAWGFISGLITGYPIALPEFNENMQDAVIFAGAMDGLF